MPHVIIKLWPGKSERQKQRLADAVSADVQRVLDYGPESVSIAFEEIEPRDWDRQVYDADIVAHQDRLYKKPGYGRLAARRA
ncbi:MAG TPA: tautomerase family protein [Gemmatimonadaceae bacterium]|nr:tautomerase family protein [Gemmatimonadaceae bacterium]